MSGHRKTKQDLLNDALNEIRNKTNKNNVYLVLPLMQWVVRKIDLMMSSEAFKKSISDAKKNKKPRPRPLLVSRGEIWQCELGKNIGSEQNESRPVLIIQNDVNNKNSPNTLIVPLTSLENRNDNHAPLTPVAIEEHRAKLRPTEVLLLPEDARDGEKNKIAQPSVLMCQNIREINKERLEFRITHVKEDRWQDINEAIKNSLGLE